MDTRVAGSMGGRRTAETHDHEHFQEIGKKGGRMNARRIRRDGISPEQHTKLSEAGRKGGESTLKRRGIDFYRGIGKKGGSVPKKHKN